MFDGMLVLRVPSTSLLESTSLAKSHFIHFHKLNVKLTLWPHFKHIHMGSISFSSSDSGGTVVLMFSLFSSFSSGLQSWQLVQSPLPESFFRRVWSDPFLMCLQDGTIKIKTHTMWEGYPQPPTGYHYRLHYIYVMMMILFTCNLKVIFLSGAFVLPPFLSHLHLSTIRNEWKSDPAVSQCIHSQK